MAVLARVVDAKGGTRWMSQERTVSATGTFTTSWRITASTEFIARWSGDASHDGDAAPLKIVTLTQVDGEARRASYPLQPRWRSSANAERSLWGIV